MNYGLIYFPTRTTISRMYKFDITCVTDLINVEPKDQAMVVQTSDAATACALK